MTIIDEVNVQSRKEIIADWYVDVFPLVAKYIQKNGGNLEEAKEVFQEAIVIYYEKLTFTDFSPVKTDQAYLLGIAKNRWLKHCSELTCHESINNVEIAEDKEEEPITQKLLHYLKLTSERCLDLLQAFYFEKLTMGQLADRFGYTSERSATVQKYKCLEKVRDQVKRKSLSYEDFLS